MKKELPNGVMLNAYPDSIGNNLADIINMLKWPEFDNVFSLFYILPTFFNSDLDRGFSIIDYDLNDELVSENHLQELSKLNISLKFDLVLNHLSVYSPQFQDMLKYGDESKYKDFFINWNDFWRGQGEMGADGNIVPRKEHLQKLFTRKPGLPILKVRFPDGSERPYWNTFYQEVNHHKITSQDLSSIARLTLVDAKKIAETVNDQIKEDVELSDIDLNIFSDIVDEVISIVEQRRIYLGQMDLNAQSDAVWEFYDETFSKLSQYGAAMIRLDAFAYLHKQPGMVNFFNKPGTWEYLDRLKQLAKKYDLMLLPEIHSVYGGGLHEEVAAEGFTIYDFFLPGLLIDALDRGTHKHLLNWLSEITEKQIKTVNMLGCHDGIPVLDLKGGDNKGHSIPGLLSDDQIDNIIANILDRGGRVKNLYGPDGKKISYYQVNATFFSALGEDEKKLLLARAIQLFMPGIPQVWYLDLFAGKNNYAEADKSSTGGHKEINRTTLTISDIEQGLKRTIVQNQLQLMRLRNTSPAFKGELEIPDCTDRQLHLTWTNGQCSVTLKADLRDHSFSIVHRDDSGDETVMSYS